VQFDQESHDREILTTEGHDVSLGRLTDRASAAGATVRGAPSGCLLHRRLLGAQMERCRGARQLQAPVRRQPHHSLGGPSGCSPF